MLQGLSLPVLIRKLRDEYVINDAVLRRIQSDIDHAEARLHVREAE